MSKEHLEIKEQLALYALGALSEEVATELTQHLRNCAECRGELDGFEDTIAWLDAQGAPLPPGFSDRVVETARSKRPSFVGAEGKSGARWLAIAAAVAVLFAGVWGGLRLSEAERRAEIAEVALQQLLADEDKLDFAKTVKGDARIVRATNKTLFVAANLVDLPASKTYQLWVISDAQPRSVTTFKAADGVAIEEIPPQEIFDAALVTIEPAGGSQVPTLPPVMSAP